MTSCLVAINKNRDMCFDMKNGKKTYFSGEIPVNDCRNVWRGLKSIRLIKKIFLRISKSFMQRITQKPILKPVVYLGARFGISWCSVWFKRSKFMLCSMCEGYLSLNDQETLELS